MERSEDKDDKENATRGHFCHLGHYMNFGSPAPIDIDWQSEDEQLTTSKVEVEEEGNKFVFNVEAATTVTDYEKFIRSLRIHREKLAKFRLEQSTSSFNEEDFLDLVLQTSSHETKLRVQQESFKLVGYHMEKDDQWLEFGHTHTWIKDLPTHIIPHSLFLEFNGYHSCILRELAQGQTLHNTLLGRQQLITAVNLLATSTDHRKRAWSLIVVIMMICQSVRLTFLFHHLTATFLRAHPLPPHFTTIVSQMENRSMTIMSILHPQQVINPPKSSILMGDFACYCHQNARFGYLDLGQHMQMPVKGPLPSRLLQVFSLRVVSICGDTVGDFYGTISFRDPVYTQHIYNREAEDSEVIFAGDCLQLTGPTNCIIVTTEDMGFNFLIFGKKIPDTFTQIRWSDLGCECDVPLVDQFVTDECSLILTFIVLTNAMQATVEITILDMDMDRGCAPVSGKVFARLAEYDYEIILFQKDHVEVHPGKVLQLSSSAVAVPWHSCVMIGVHLYYDDDDDDDADDDDVEGVYFANGIAQFCTRHSGQEDKIMQGFSSRILLRVTWK